MKILQVSYSLPPEPGGKETHVVYLSQEQLRSGHEVMLAFRRGDVVPKGATVLRIRSNPLSRALVAKSDVLAFARDVARALRDARRVDLVHLHGDHVEALFLGPVCRRLGIPLVISLHAALARRHRQIMRRALSRADAFVAIGSRPTQDLVSLGIDPRRILTMSSGLDLARLSDLRAQAVREPGLIVSVGSLIAMKNHGLLIEAVHRLRRTRPGIRLIIAGEGPDRSLLRRLSGSDGAIELVGQLSADEVYGLVRRAEVFVLASRRLVGKAEGVPTAALEALALGTPVVLSSEATLDPVVPADGTYRTFESGSLDDLVAVLGDVLDDEEGRGHMSAIGVQATAALGWPEVARRMEDWYRLALVST